jgi:hypothetical protein
MYQNKYIKYKIKYYQLKNKLGGAVKILNIDLVFNEFIELSKKRKIIGQGAYGTVYEHNNHYAIKEQCLLIAFKSQ